VNIKKNKLSQVITTYISYRHDPGPPTAEWRPKGIASHRLDSHAVCIQQPTAGTRRDTWIRRIHTVPVTEGRSLSEWMEVEENDRMVSYRTL